MSESDGIADHIIDQLVDTNPEETAEWHQSFDALVKHAGPTRARYIMLSLLKRAHEKSLAVPALDSLITSTPFRQSANRNSLAMKRWNVEFARLSVGMQRY